MITLMTLLVLSQQPIVPVAQGIASYYTIDSSSRLTASGEHLDDEEMTCAMNIGAFGTYFLVVAENGRSVVVRLNDRGPHVRGRVIDLSEGAMRQLDPRAGLMRVKVFRLGTSPPDQSLAGLEQSDLF